MELLLTKIHGLWLRGSRALACLLMFFGMGYGLVAFAETSPQYEELTLYVPAAKEGGWDLTAQAIKDALIKENLVERVNIRYSPGAGGLIGLAQFLEGQDGKSNALLVGGMFMVGAASSNQASVSLLDTTLIARLTGDAIAIAVPADSPITDMDGLIEALVTDPSMVTWVGGSQGGSDELIVKRIVGSLGVSPSKVLYSGLPGGGGVSQALLENRFSAGVSGYSEFEKYVDEGLLRVLAVSAEGRLPGLDVPSLSELGMNISLVNWRGVFAPSNISAEQEKMLVNLIGQMVATETWKADLDRLHWQDVFLTGPAFRSFVEEEQKQANQRIGSFATRTGDADIISVLGRRYFWLMIALGMVGILFVLLLVYRHYSLHREQSLRLDLEESIAYAEQNAAELQKVLSGISAHVEEEFEKWGLSDAEKDVGMLMLKGLRLKEIADTRKTSERTVRQQAQSIYVKSGIEGRSSLSAYFLEDFLAPPPSEAGQ